MPIVDLITAANSWLTARGSSLAEVGGVVTGALNVWLAARQHLWSWPLGILNAICYAVVFARAGLYSDTGLQAVYFVLSVLGWVHWWRGGPGQTPLPVTSASRSALVRYAAAGTVLWALLATISQRLPGSSLPALDAALVAGSLVAQVMMVRKLRENWLLWIALDVIYVAMFVYKGLWLTALLYVLFTGLAIHGFRTWHAAWIRSTALASSASS